MSKRAPRVGEWVLRRLVPIELRDAVTGDFAERYELERVRRGERKARVWYWLELARIRPLSLRLALRASRGVNQGGRRPGMGERVRDLMIRDVRQGVRVMRRKPGFALAAVLTLGLGTGAATAVFSLVEGVVLSPLPFREPERLVMLWETQPHENALRRRVSPVNFLDYRALDRVFEDAAAWWRPEYDLADELDEPMRVSAVEVSENLFDVLGVSPVMGRGFPRDSTLHSNESEVVISDRLWRSRFRGDATVLGRTVNLNGSPFTVVGVLPAGFHFPGETDVWQRLYWNLAGHSRGAHFMEAIGRLRPGVTVEQADAALARVASRLAEENPVTNRDWGVRVVRLDEELAGVFRPALLALLGASALLLAIACINVANLLLARSTARATEVAVRAALGASRLRLVSQLLAESLVLAIAGAGLGAVTAVLGVRAFLAWTPVDIPRADEVSVNGVVLAFALGISILTAVGFGLAPALALTRTRLRESLRRDSRADGAAGGGRTRSVLVATEVALAVILLSGAGLLIRSVVQMLRVDSGVSATRVVTADLQLSNSQYPNFGDIARFYGRLGENLRQHPGVTAAGASNFLPLESGWTLPFAYPGAPTEPGRQPVAQFHSVDEGWFDALGIRLVSGRPFDVRDDSTRPGVVIVNEAAVKRFWPGQDVVGQRIAYASNPIGPLGRLILTNVEHEVIGVVSDVRNASLENEPEPAIYFTQRQFPFRNMHVYVRGPADESALLTILSEEVRRLDPGIPVAHAQALERILSAPADPPRLVMFVLLVFAALALLLAAIGIYGILSYVVTSRGREIGIRMALGARPAEVLRMVLRQGLALGVSGAVLGVLGAAASGRLLSGLLFGVQPADPVTLATVFALAMVVALLACLMPGRRAAGTQPMRALRSE